MAIRSARIRSRSSPSASRALTSRVSVPNSVPTSTLATGLVLRLWYHPGLSGAVALEATTTWRSPSCGTSPAWCALPRCAPATVVVTSVIGPRAAWQPTVLPARGRPSRRLSDSMNPDARSMRSRASRLLWARSTRLRPAVSRLHERGGDRGRDRDGSSQTSPASDGGRGGRAVIRSPRREPADGARTMTLSPARSCASLRGATISPLSVIATTRHSGGQAISPRRLPTAGDR